MGALGDFAVAGTGALSTKIPDSGREFRGVSFATGRQRINDGRKEGREEVRKRAVRERQMMRCDLTAAEKRADRQD